MKALRRDDQSDSRSKIFKGLDGIRVIITFFILYAHVYLLISSGFTADPHNYEKGYDSVIHRITLSGTNTVQVYFFISGLLLAFTLQGFSKVSQHNLTWTLMPMIIFKRWWRLTPSAATVIGFMATWMRHVSYGPLWALYVTNGPTKQCREYFWAHMLYFNNYLPEDTSCAFQTWYIGADMQLSILGLIVHFIIINRSRKHKIITFSVLVFMGSVIPMVQVWAKDLDAFAMIKPESFRTLSDDTLRNFHMLGHNNLTGFFIGMANGYLACHYFAQKKWNYSNTRITTFLNWSLFPLFVGVLYCGSLFFRDDERAPVTLRMLYAGASVVTYGIICSLWVLGAMLKSNESSQSLMEWQGWLPPSTLSYSVYLIHPVIIHIILGTRTQLTPVSYLNFYLIYVGIVVVSFLAALPLYLLVEAPARRLFTVLMVQKSKGKIS